MRESPPLKDLILTLESLVEKKPGPEARFRAEHALLALIKLRRRRIGRRSLAAELGLGEGSVRSLLRRLGSAGLVESSRSGWGLTRSGEEFVRQLEALLQGPVRVGAGDLTVSSRDAAILVRGGARGVTTGLGIRDAAFRAGADGATVLVLESGDVYFPDGVRCPDDLQRRAREISRILGAGDGDAIIIGTSEDQNLAELGAAAGALSLLRRLASPGPGREGVRQRHQGGPLP